MNMARAMCACTLDSNLRKIYALLGSVVDILVGSNSTGVEQRPNLPVSHKLGWKSVLGPHLWFVQPLDTSIVMVFDVYDNH